MQCEEANNHGKLDGSRLSAILLGPWYDKEQFSTCITITDLPLFPEQHALETALFYLLSYYKSRVFIVCSFVPFTQYICTI